LISNPRDGRIKQFASNQRGQAALPDLRGCFDCLFPRE
jgi:hypothetical protein